MHQFGGKAHDFSLVARNFFNQTLHLNFSIHCLGEKAWPHDYLIMNQIYNRIRYNQQTDSTADARIQVIIHCPVQRLKFQIPLCQFLAVWTL